jgi:hypothetical protein
MSRILKRPMFRKGGSPNKGIMTGLVDRKQYATGIDKEELAKNVGVLEEVLRDYTPKTRVPYGAFGLDIATGTPVLEAFKKRYGQFTTADDKREAAIKGGAAKLGISKALEKKTVGTLKQGRNTSNQTLFGVAPGKTGFFSSEQLMAGQGIIQPIDTRMAFTFDAKTNTLKQEPVSEIDRRRDNEVKAKSLGTQYNILGDLVGDMKTRLPATVTGATGVGFGLVEGFADQFAQLGESFGIKDGLVIKDEGVIDQYLKDKGFTEKAQSAATMKASVINLGYALAKIAEPDNPRLSEGDIIRQLNRINFGASREVFSASLDQILKEEGIRANREIENLGFSFDDIVNPSKKKNTTGTTGTQDKDSNYNPLGFDESRLSPRTP